MGEACHAKLVFVRMLSTEISKILVWGTVTDRSMILEISHIDLLEFHNQVDSVGQINCAISWTSDSNPVVSRCRSTCHLAIHIQSTST